MNIIQVQYSTIKEIFELAPAYYVATSDGYTIYSVTDEFFVETSISSEDDVEDYEDNYKAGHTSVASRDDAQLLGYKQNYKTLVSPKQNDGTPVVLPCLFPTGVFLYVTGSGDGESVRGAGTKLIFKRDTAGDTVKYVNFLDAVYEADAIVQFTGADVKDDESDGDYLEVAIVAPATEVTPNGGNTGNCNVVNHVIVPATGNGAYDVVLANAIPVPVENPSVSNGYWDLSVVLVGKGAITPNLTGSGRYHLLDIEMPLIRHGNQCWLLGSSNVEVSIPAIEAKAILPQWKGKFTVHNHGHSGLKVAVTLKLARAKTL